MLLVSLATATAAMAFSPEVTQVLDEALEDVRKDLADAAIDKGKTIAVVPPLLKGDQSGFLAGRLKPMMKNAGLNVIEHTDSEFVEQIVKEHPARERWNKMGVLDKSALVLIGETLKTAEYLVYGSIRQPHENERRIYVEMELHIASIKTAEYIWGGVFAKSMAKPAHRLPPPEEVPYDELHEAIRETLAASFADVADALEQTDALRDKKIALTPFGNDADRYVLGFVKQAITEAGLTWTDLGAHSMGEAYAMIYDKPQQANAVVTGAWRGKTMKPLRDEFTNKVWEVFTEVQIDIQDAGGNGIFSKMVMGKDEYRRVTTPEEVAKIFLRKHPKAPLVAIGIVVGLILLGMFFKATRRVR